MRIYYSNPSSNEQRAHASGGTSDGSTCNEIRARLESKAHREHFARRGRYLKSEGQRMGHRLRLLVDDRFVGNGIFTDAHRALVILAGSRPCGARDADGNW